MITHAFPTSLLDAMARNDILQILVFSVFLGVALSALKHDKRVGVVIQSIDGMVPVMLRLTNYVMRAAPLGVFGAIASSVTLRGRRDLTYGKLIGAFYLGLLVLWMILIGVGHAFLGRRVVSLLKAVREPALIAFSTASSEAAYPRLTEQLEVRRRQEGGGLHVAAGLRIQSRRLDDVSGICRPLHRPGVRRAHAAVGAGVHAAGADVEQQGHGGVPRGSVVVVAAVAPMFHLPVAGVAMVLAIDQILDMGRTMTNEIGNSVATAVIAKWEGRRAVKSNGAVFDEPELNA